MSEVVGQVKAKRSRADEKAAKASKTKRWLIILSALNGSWEEDGSRLSTRQIHSAVCSALRIPDSANSLRNTQRDLEEIEASGIVGISKATEVGHSVSQAAPKAPPERITYWRLDDNPLNLDLDRNHRLSKSPDALILMLASRHLKHLLPTDVAARLEALADQGERFLATRTTPSPWAKPWQSKLRIDPRGHALEKPQIREEILASVYGALNQHRQLRLGYFRPGKPPVESDYEPLGLVYRDPLTYLVASHVGRGVPHSLALHRIVSAEVLAVESTASRDFDLDAFIREDRNAQTNARDVRVRIRVTPGMLDHWRLAKLGASQTEERHADGGGTISATVNDTDELRRYLLGLGSQVQVLEPETIKDWILQQARHMADDLPPIANRAMSKK